MKYYKTVWVNGKQIRTHRYVMQKHLGRELRSNEIVHHIDGNKANNDISNLEIVSRSEHIKMHPEIAEKSLNKRKRKIDVDLVIEMYKIKPIRDIAKHFNVAPMTIWNRLKKAGIKTNKRGHKY